MKQTAVEWLVQELRGYDAKGDFIFNGVINSELIEQAKEMEKEQMMQCYEDGYNRVAKLLVDAAKQNGLNLNL